jgi:hypothetical protein
MLRENIHLAVVASLTRISLEIIKDLQASELDNSRTLVSDFLELSESSLKKVWINPEEDEAWKDL